MADLEGILDFRVQGGLLKFTAGRSGLQGEHAYKEDLATRDAYEWLDKAAMTHVRHLLGMQGGHESRLYSI